MKIGIIDDEKVWRDNATEIIQEYYNDTIVVDVYSCGEYLLKKEIEYDIVFIDVEMEGIDGFETAEKYKSKYPDSIIIMLTMHIELSRKGYFVNAFRYIDKANMLVEIPEALNATDKLLERNKKIEINVVNLGRVILMQKDIMFVETELRNVHIHTTGKEYLCTDNMTYMKEHLDFDKFYGCHKSYIVNLDAIDTFDRFFVYMVDGSKAMVSSRRYAELKRRYLERKLECANG